MNNPQNKPLVLEIPKHVMLVLRSWRDMGKTEVTGFFVTEKGNPLKVIDAVIVEATCTMASVDIKPEAITAMYAAQIAKGIYPDQMGIWWHTHPGNGPHPSSQDWSTFRGLGKDRTLNIMYILACGDAEFAFIGVTDHMTKLTIEMELTVAHPHTRWEKLQDWDELSIQYADCVKTYVPVLSAFQHPITVIPSAGFGIGKQQSLFPEHGLACPAFAHQYLFDELPIQDQHCFIELYNKVRRFEITPDEADMLAQEQACGKDFFTDIYNDPYMMGASCGTSTAAGKE